MSVPLKDNLIKILLRDEHISEDLINEVLCNTQYSELSLSEVLIKLKIMDENQLAPILSESLEIPILNLCRLSVDEDLIGVLPRAIVKKYCVFPVSLVGDYLTLAMTDPGDLCIIDDIKSVTGFSILPIISRRADINDMIMRYYDSIDGFSSEYLDEDVRNGDKTVFEETLDTVEEFDDIVRDMSSTEDTLKEENTEDSLTEASAEQPVIKLVYEIMQRAVVIKASDIFIEPMEKRMRIRYRVDGIIEEYDSFALALMSFVVSRIKVIAGLNISERRLPQDGRCKAIVSGNRYVDFRVSVLPVILGERIVMRVLDSEGTTALDIDKIGFEKKDLQKLKDISKKPYGLILACGPTGSGKTTTLYSILNTISTPEKNVVTVEDPIEFEMEGINQVNVNIEKGLTFSNSLRSILRQDPDVILIGEIRDSETMDIAVKAALTGHMVLSSLHTTTAAGSIIRMINMGVEPFLICSSVLAVVAQRLVRCLCEECKEEHIVSPELAKKVEWMPKEYKVFRDKGCESCGNTGYKGRVGISEILIFSPDIRDLILSGLVGGEMGIKCQAIKEGMVTLRQSALSKVLEGSTSLQEVLRITATDKNL